MDLYGYANLFVIYSYDGDEDCDDFLGIIQKKIFIEIKDVIS